MNLRIIPLMCLALLTAGCSLYRINSEETAETYYPSKVSAQDVVYLETVTQPNEVIGTVTVNTERNQPLEEIVEKMKREAAMMGGDAITNITTAARTPGKKSTPHKLLGNASIRTNFTGTVLKLMAEESVSAQKEPESKQKKEQESAVIKK